MDSDSDCDSDGYGAHRSVLMNAIVAENCRVVGNLILSHREDVNRRFYTEEYGEWTYLAFAASRGCSKSVQILLEMNADPVQGYDYDKSTPLHIACKNDHVNVVAILCRHAPRAVSFPNRDEDTPLHVACVHQHVECVRILCKSGALVKATNRYMKTPLHSLFHSFVDEEEQEVEEIASLLLKSGAEINASDSEGKTVFHIASEAGYEIIVKFLLKNGADLDLRVNRGGTALHIAVINGHFSFAHFLLDYGASPNILCSEDNTSPLHIAAECGQTGLIRALIEKGAAIDEQCKLLRTPLLYASMKGHMSAVELLLGNGALVNSPDYEENTPILAATQGGHFSVLRALVSNGALINAQNNLGNTPLHLACVRGDLDVVQFLLEAGAAVNMVDKSERNSLHDVCSYEFQEPNANRLPFLRALLSKGALINAQDENGYTPLHDACTNESFEVVQFLLEAGASVNLVTCSGSSLLHFACTVEIAEALLSHGSNVNLPDNDGSTPLLIAIENDTDDVAEVLIRHGADVRVMHSRAINALCWVASLNLPKMIRMLNSHFLAVERDQALVFACKVDKIRCDRDHQVYDVLEALTTLLDLGANLNYVDSNGRTALSYASKRRCVSCVEFLLNNGADIDIVDRRGKTPLMMAVNSGNEDVVKLLLQSGANVHAIDSKGRSALTRACAKSYSWVVRSLLEYEAGAFVECPHKYTSLVNCLYKHYRYDNATLTDTFEKVITKMSIANLMSGTYQGMSLLEPIPDYNRLMYSMGCKDELRCLHLVKFPGTEITYMDALTQNSTALAHPEVQSLLLPQHSTFWQSVEHNYPRYGRMIRIRLQIGQEKKTLIKKSFDFFHFLGVNVYAAEMICLYLSNYDLRTISSVVVYEELTHSVSEDSA